MTVTTKLIRTVLISAVIVSLTGVFAYAQTAAYLDAKNWTAAVMQPGGGGMKANPQGIVQGKGELRFAGFHLGKEAQYSLSPDLAKAFENKLVTLTVTLNGEFVSGDASFLAFVQRNSSPLTIFWSQQAYALLFKGSQIEIQKHGKGTNPNIIVKYSDIPALGFKTFPVGKPIKVSYGIVKTGAFPRMIVKVNGIEVASVLDNKYGQTVKSMPGNVFSIGVIATNKETGGDPNSKSYLSLSDIQVE